MPAALASIVLWLLVAFAVQACPEALAVQKRPLAGERPVDLCRYAGQVVIVVNTASKCGFTPQYDGLEALYRRYESRGLVVLGFPSNDFGAQEPGSEAQIQAFCRLTYGVEFPMFEKTHVARGTSDPLYRYLAELAGEYPAWNFHKYVLDRQGRLAASLAGQVDPMDPQFIRLIEELL